MSKRYITEIISLGFRVGASDIHLIGGRSALYRVNGQLIHREETPSLSGQTIREWGTEMLRESRIKAQMDDFGQADFATPFEDFGRLRINIYCQSGSWAAALRLIPKEIPGMDDLGVPVVIRDLLEKEGGLLLISGASGNGKSTTLAAMIDYVNQFQRRHIITLEDPIEFQHCHQNSIVSQREIGCDTTSFAQGLRSALRQDPDIIMIGEMRDLETIAIAITAAETGHLVLASLHSSNAVQSLERIVDVFPYQHQAQIRGQVASSLLAIMNQQLIPAIDGQERLMAAEIMVNNPAIRNLIRENKIHQIDSAIHTGTTSGMQSMVKAIRFLLQQKKISLQEARRRLGSEWL